MESDEIFKEVKTKEHSNTRWTLAPKSDEESGAKKKADNAAAFIILSHKSTPIPFQNGANGIRTHDLLHAMCFFGF
jgi:hypothetical protein